MRRDKANSGESNSLATHTQNVPADVPACQFTQRVIASHLFNSQVRQDNFHAPSELAPSLKKMN
ncbi:MAG: hypothetical protein B6D41_18040 [Chloroflexi bacterium UTCFX4]|nr:MAG: hypothetical protein B6D41_18040 [Chloroflexi bacterium UTCFX4]